MAEEFDLLEEEKKRKRKGEPPPPNTGTLLMAALAILLLAFFILLVSMATVDSNKRQKVLTSVAGTFGVLEGGTGLAVSQAMAPGGAPKRTRFQASLAMFRDMVRVRGLEEEVTVDGSSKGFTISLSGSLLFRAGGAELDPRSYILLDTVKFIIVDGQEKFRIRIEGHTDDVPARSERYPSNWELSVARSLAVLRYFLRDSGIESKSLEAAGFAEFHPKFPNDSPENRARNRRVDITFLVKAPGADVDPRKAIEVEGFRFAF